MGRKKGLRELEDMEAMVEMEGARVFGLWLLVKAVVGECAGANVFIVVVHRRHFKCGTSSCFFSVWFECYGCSKVAPLFLFFFFFSFVCMCLILTLPSLSGVKKRNRCVSAPVVWLLHV